MSINYYSNVRTTGVAKFDRAFVEYLIKFVPNWKFISEDANKLFANVGGYIFVVWGFNKIFITPSNIYIAV